MGIRKQNGFSLLEVMIAAGIGSVLAFAVATLLAWTAQNQARAMEIAQIEAFKQNILRTLATSTALSNTIARNQPAMACLLPDAVVPCNPNAAQFFDLYDAKDELVFDSTNPASGLTSAGERCPAGTQFSLAGNDACPFRYELRWSAVCSSTGTPPCLNPEVMVSAHLLYRPSPDTLKRRPLNEDRLSIHHYYFKKEACLATNNQAFLTNGTAADLNTTFVVPQYTKKLYVELWGGGGGGGSYNIFASYVNGMPGGNSTFGAVTANGGDGAQPTEFSNCSWWFVGGMGFFFPWAGQPGCDGYPAQPADLNFLTTISNNSSCAPLAASNAGGNGGATAGAAGLPYGGGGASGAAWWTDGATWAFLYVPARGPDNGGKYVTATFTPATLPPGSTVPITIGAGGTGGMGWGFVASWGVFWPGPAGNGASGLVKITWE